MSGARHRRVGNACEREVVDRHLDLGIKAERMIGHLPRGLIRTYDVYDRVTEKRDGFAKLEREIDLILNPAPAAVVAFRR
jgi:hypothetical protein